RTRPYRRRRVEMVWRRSLVVLVSGESTRPSVCGLALLTGGAALREFAVRKGGARRESVLRLAGSRSSRRLIRRSNKGFMAHGRPPVDSTTGRIWIAETASIRHTEGISRNVTVCGHGVRTM